VGWVRLPALERCLTTILHHCLVEVEGLPDAGRGLLVRAGAASVCALLPHSGGATIRYRAASHEQLVGAKCNPRKHRVLVESKGRKLAEVAVVEAWDATLVLERDDFT
jgi:hypothetical protein